MAGVKANGSAHKRERKQHNKPAGFAVIRWARDEASVGSPQERLLLLCLATYADGSGKCIPSIENLMHDTVLSRSTVFRLLRSLEERGLVGRQQRFHASSTYSLRPATPFDKSVTADTHNCQEDTLSRGRS
jgi:DNA-binding MarR family transcriptional regulator